MFTIVKIVHRLFAVITFELSGSVRSEWNTSYTSLFSIRFSVSAFLGSGVPSRTSKNCLLFYLALSWNPILFIYSLCHACHNTSLIGVLCCMPSHAMILSLPSYGKAISKESCNDENWGITRHIRMVIPLNMCLHVSSLHWSVKYLHKFLFLFIYLFNFYFILHWSVTLWVKCERYIGRALPDTLWPM